MSLGKRAKIFSPFYALKGFTDAVEAKEALYVERTELSEDECARLENIITDLQELVRNCNAARENNITVPVTHFVPCADENNAPRTVCPDQRLRKPHLHGSNKDDNR